MFLLVTVLWIAEAVIVVFIADFLMVRAVIVKNYQINLKSMVYYFSFVHVRY